MGHYYNKYKYDVDEGLEMEKNETCIHSKNWSVFI